jgi:hypothetical protein
MMKSVQDSPFSPTVEAPSGCSALLAKKEWDLALSLHPAPFPAVFLTHTKPEAKSALGTTEFSPVLSHVSKCSGV